MRFVAFLLTKLLVYVLIIVIGVTVVFLVPRLLPSGPVEALLARIMAGGGFMEPAQVESMRVSLTQTFGLEGTLWEQYRGFIERVLLAGDFGPSLAMFPTSVNVLIRQALPWTLGLLLTATIIAWILGNVIGVIAGYRKDKAFSKVLELIAVAVYPIPYYILALILIILLAYLWPVFPMSVHVRSAPLSLRFLATVVHNSFLPALSIIIVGVGWWVISMKALSSSVCEEDFVQFARLRRVSDGTIMTRYVARNAILPQITALALMIGGVFNGALITEIIFDYPGLGSLTYMAVMQSDYNLLMGTVTLSIVAVATATLVIDLLYPFFDPRIRYR